VHSAVFPNGKAVSGKSIPNLGTTPCDGAIPLQAICKKEVIDGIESNDAASLSSEP